ncbi:J domain-containing protein [Candidatus Desantisbacteria bacterium]|nr:J domain-containing protein [Candidatus Desantisbacteria bacterium]
MPKDYYEILGLKKDTSDEDIKRTFRTLAKKFHPDANPGNKRSEERFKEINEAYEVLGDKEKRKQYDQMKDAEARGFDFSNVFGEDKSHGRYEAGGSSDLNFGDIFSSIFGNRESSRQDSRGNFKGEDVNYEITIPFEQSITGGKTKITIPSKGQCPACGGSGAKQGTSAKTCTSCKGSGSIVINQGGFAFKKPCPKCFGKGGYDIYCKIYINIAQAILGSKVKVKTISGSIIIKIPPFTQNDTILRIHGQGVKIPSGGKGDQFIKIKIETPKKINEKQKDLIAEFAKEGNLKY